MVVSWGHPRSRPGRSVYIQPANNTGDARSDVRPRRGGGGRPGLGPPTGSRSHRSARSRAERFAAIVLRTSAGPLAPVWRLAYASAAQALALYLRGWTRGATVYVRGTLATGEPTLGLSDVDLEVVADSPNAAERINARAEALRRRSWGLTQLFSMCDYDSATPERA